MEQVWGDQKFSLEIPTGGVCSLPSGEGGQAAGYMGLEPRGVAQTNSTNLGLSRRLK